MPVTPAVQAFADAVSAEYDKIGANVDSLVQSLSGINADVAFLKKTITDLQNSSGTVTPEDQAMLDALQARITQLGGNLEAARNVANAIDAQTDEPPTPTP